MTVVYQPRNRHASHTFFICMAVLVVLAFAGLIYTLHVQH
jgi:predicted membrane channel-forming protein YqfA (hemolysin III family)